MAHGSSVYAARFLDEMILQLRFFLVSLAANLYRKNTSGNDRQALCVCFDVRTAGVFNMLLFCLLMMKTTTSFNPFHTMKHRHRLTLVCVCAALTVLLLPLHTVRLVAQTQQDASKAASVFQAVYIYNITRYVYFPPSKTTGDYVIGILGRTDVGSSLERTATVKKAGLTGQTIRVVAYDSPVQAMSECHIVFISDKFLGRLGQIAKLLKGQPTLIITEGAGNANGIPAISMLASGEKKFQVNNKAIEEVNLKVSADFLRFAAVVQ
jgi:YfiR/HmsC-like